MVTSWGYRGARAKGIIHDNVMHMSEVEPECVMGLGQAEPGQGPRRARLGYDLRVLWSWVTCEIAGMWLLVGPTGDIT